MVSPTNRVFDRVQAVRVYEFTESDRTLVESRLLNLCIESSIKLYTNRDLSSEWISKKNFFVLFSYGLILRFNDIRN